MNILTKGFALKMKIGLTLSYFTPIGFQGIDKAVISGESFYP